MAVRSELKAREHGSYQRACPPVSCRNLLIASISMEAHAWTAIALLGAILVGSLFYLGNRIDSLGARLDSRIDGLSGRIDGLTARVEDQGRQLGSQIYELAAKLDEHLRRHAS